jgi:hypothetical protein
MGQCGNRPTVIDSIPAPTRLTPDKVASEHRITFQMRKMMYGTSSNAETDDNEKTARSPLNGTGPVGKKLPQLKKNLYRERPPWLPPELPRDPPLLGALWRGALCRGALWRGAL